MLYKISTQFKVLLILIFIAAFAFIAVVVDFAYALYKPFDINEPDFYVVKKGATIKYVAQELEEKGYIRRSFYFIYYTMFKGVTNQLKAGEYHITLGMNAHDLLEEMIAGNVVLRSMTLIEGWTFRQAMNAIEGNQYLVKELDYNDVDRVSLQLGFSEQHPEGKIYPDTYSFPRGTTDAEFLRRAWNIMQERLQQEWEKRDLDTPLKTAYDALILASIIEKETAVADERDVIAAVFINRLKKRMRLQTDPTVIYGLGENFDGDIKYRDLRKDTPYNTYTRSGLPPTPIALPGLASIRAALHPAKTDALYFVARGDGSHQFSKTLEEHNHAVGQFQKRRRSSKKSL